MSSDSSISLTTSSPSAETEPRVSPSAKTFVPPPPPPRPVNGDTTPVRREIFFFSEERLKSKAVDARKQDKNIQAKLDTSKESSKDNEEISSRKSPSLQPSCKELPIYGCKERSLDFPSTRFSGTSGSQKNNPRHSSNDKDTKESVDKLEIKGNSLSCSNSPTDPEGVDENDGSKYLKEHHHHQHENISKKPSPDSCKNNKFTWCGSCKVSSSKSRPASKGKPRTSSTSPLKRLSRSSLQTPEVSDSGKIALNLSKYSPCASRLAASSKILSSGNSLSASSPGATASSPESPVHGARAKSPLHQQPAGQQPQRPARRGRGAAASPMSEPASPTRDLPSPLLLPEDAELHSQSSGDQSPSPRAIAPASAIELSLERDRRSSSYRCPR